MVPGCNLPSLRSQPSHPSSRQSKSLDTTGLRPRGPRFKKKSGSSSSGSGSSSSSSPRAEFFGQC
ncbi:hypothetical protein F511_09521 [Dorcoceras hygrometricum]|uniref:Uncharacterized protein n=1 Tax=Dorcoceras hygrometricum TaxID=472368 RepID=A0A2Z7BUA4_9LAMI|nr:hypothetical protein F511_09521 [Dorcoceras hygrometricum]